MSRPERQRRPYVRQIDRELSFTARKQAVRAKVAGDPAMDNAMRYAREYSGDFQFMVDMRRRAQDPLWTPTPKQTVAILRCLDRALQGAGRQPV